MEMRLCRFTQQKTRKLLFNEVIVYKASERSGATLVEFQVEESDEKSNCIKNKVNLLVTKNFLVKVQLSKAAIFS